ncbi:hypothetical protein JAO73_20155 [Hymenobacter sp. BT523]|uniref:hypothetical protein n=1 Tax=Hymenobacter sp. BT523 TaxID=2795725 RepID=UPI0018ECC84C|nr:hypothetical protein [Hymenobacter sp. BT523]MBJ6111345.1 hypothetical protein [Hymenobacter sp. BT523]
MSLFYYLLGGLLLTAPAALARPPAAVPRDTIKGRPAVPRLPRNRFVAQYDSRYSIINHHLTTINGLKLGLEFKSRFRTGAAIYFLSTGVPTRQAKPDNAAEDADAQLRFRYLAAYAGYVLLEKPRWEISANLQLGMGSVYVLYEADDGDLDKTPRDFLGVAEPALAAQYRLLHWAGFGTGLGWRQPLFVPRAVQKELNGPVFYLRANVFLGELVKVLKQKEPLFSQEGLRRD